MDLSQTAKQMWAMGYGRNPQSGKDVSHGDLHFWLVDKDGNIIDPTPSAYPYKKHYRPFKNEYQKKFLDFWWNMWKTHPHKNIMKKLLYTNPQDRKCMYNCFVYLRHHKDCKIVIGSLGFELSKGSVFWEFG